MSLFHSVPVSASLLVRFPLREPAWRSDGVVSPPLTYSYDSPQASAAKKGSENEKRERGGGTGESRNQSAQFDSMSLSLIGSSIHVVP
jgi:hypothetical protein